MRDVRRRKRSSGGEGEGYLKVVSEGKVKGG